MNTLALTRRFVDVSLPKLDRWACAMLAIVVCVSVVIVMLPAFVLWLSFREAHPIEPVSAYSLLHYAEVFGDPFVIRVLINTFTFSFVTLIVAFFFGIPAAWLVERTDLPGKPAVLTLMTLGLLMPGFAAAMGWLFLLHPRIGIINRVLMDVFALTDAPFNITSIVGMGWVMGLSLAPLAFIMTAAVLRAIDPALEESAHMSGVSFFNVMRKVTLPLAWPGILAAGIYIFTIGFAAFDVPAIIGWSNKIFTFSTYSVLQLSATEGLPRYGAVAALSMVVVAIAGLLIWWYSRLQAHAHRYQVVTGKGYRPRIVALGGHVWTAWGFLGVYFTLSKLLPLLVIVWASLLPYFRYPSAAAFQTISLRNFERIPWDMMLDGMINTGILMVLTPTLALIVAVAFSWIVLRSKLPGRQVFDFVAFLPHAVPNIVFGLAALLFMLFVLQHYIPIHGTIWILLAVFVIARLSYATRMTNSTLMQIHKDLEEAATMSGVSTGVTVWRVIVPLIGPSLVYAWLWMALLTYRELTLAVVLSTRDNLTLPIVVWNAWFAGGFGNAAAITLILMAMMVPLVALYWWLMRRKGGALHGA
jgi:iron(III) transport system permease protein